MAAAQVRRKEVTAMTFIVAAAFLLGIALGRHFQVLIVLPASILQLLFATGAGIIALHEGGWLLVTVVLAAVACVQLGYLAGGGTRHLWGEPDLRSARFNDREQRVPFPR
jgi:hypothetical protein